MVVSMRVSATTLPAYQVSAEAIEFVTRMPIVRIKSFSQIGSSRMRTLGRRNNATRNSSGAANGDVQHDSSSDYVAKRLIVESHGKLSQRLDPDNCRLRTSTFWDTAGGIGQHAGITAEEHHLSLAGVGADIQDGERIALRRIRDQPQSTGPRLLRCISNVFRWCRALIVEARISRLQMPYRVHDALPPPEDIQRAGPHPSTVTAIADSSQRKSAGTKDKERAIFEEIERLRRKPPESYTQTAELTTQLEYQPQKHHEVQPKSLTSLPNTVEYFSEVDVLQGLEQLNTRVQWDTMYMAGCFAQYFRFGTMVRNPTKEQVSAVRRVSGYVGSALAESLGATAPQGTLKLLPVAFQAYLALAVRQTACCASESGCDESSVKGIITVISDILLAAGCISDQSDLISKVTSQFERKLTSFVNRARRLNKMLVNVSNFEVFIPRPGERFHDETMVDTEGVGTQEASVLCATSLGLTKRIPVLETGTKQKVMVLKASVLLESFLDY